MSRPLIEQNLKELVPTAAGGCSHLPHSDLVQLVRSRFPGFSISSKELKFETDFNASDMAWNHMDFSHRPWVHNLYNDGLRAVMGREVCFGFSPVAWTPFIVHTFDLKVNDTTFRQYLNIAGVFTVFMQMSILPSVKGNQWKIEWTILSRGYLKFFHRFLHGALTRLNTRLFDEDIPIKTHRNEIRKQGYKPIANNDGYLESTLLTEKNISRPIAPVLTVDLKGVPVGVRHTVESANRKFILLREHEHKLLIWDSVCSHQGGPLCQSKQSGNSLVCPWHGLPVPALPLTSSRTEVKGDGYEAKVVGDILTLTPTTDRKKPQATLDCSTPGLSKAA